MHQLLAKHFALLLTEVVQKFFDRAHLCVQQPVDFGLGRGRPIDLFRFGHIGKNALAYDTQNFLLIQGCLGRTLVLLVLLSFESKLEWSLERLQLRGDAIEFIFLHVVQLTIVVHCDDLTVWLGQEPLTTH